MADINALRTKLAHTVTTHDIKESKKKGYNPNALALYIGRVDDVCNDVAAGASLGRALYDNFNDRLLTTLEKACGLPVTYGGGSQDKGRTA